MGEPNSGKRAAERIRRYREAMDEAKRRRDEIEEMVAHTASGPERDFAVGLLEMMVEHDVEAGDVLDILRRWSK